MENFKTVKMSAGQMKELGTFKAVNKKGEVAEVTINGEDTALVTIGEDQKVLKLDSLRRAWLVVEGSNEVSEEVKGEEAAEEDTNEVNADLPKEEVGEGKEEAAEVEAGDNVLTPDGKLGKVVDVVGTLATVVVEGEDFPVNVAGLKVVQKGSDLPKANEDAAKGEEAAAKGKGRKGSKKGEAKASTESKNTKATEYEKMVKELEPTEVIESKEGNYTKSYYEKDGIKLEYYIGTIEWLALGDSGDEMVTEWELLKSKKNGGWHGVFFKENGEVVKDAEAAGKKMKDPSKSKSFVSTYLKEVYGVEIKL